MKLLEWKPFAQFFEENSKDKENFRLIRRMQALEVISIQVLLQRINVTIPHSCRVLYCFHLLSAKLQFTQVTPSTPEHCSQNFVRFYGIIATPGPKKIVISKILAETLDCLDLL